MSNEKKRRMFYKDEGFNAWIPLETLDIAYFDGIDNGDAVNLEIKIMEMTDQEYADIPEAS